MTIDLTDLAPASSRREVLEQFREVVRTAPGLPDRLRERFERGEDDTWQLFYDVDLGAHTLVVEFGLPDGGRHFVAYGAEEVLPIGRFFEKYLPKIDYAMHEVLAGRKLGGDGAG